MCVGVCVCLEWIFDYSNCCHSNGSVGVRVVFLLSQDVLKEVQANKVSWSCSGRQMNHVWSRDGVSHHL